MNTFIRTNTFRVDVLATAIAASLLLGACVATPAKPTAPSEARTKLTQLQSNPQLTARTAVAVKDAETAVRAAEVPQRDAELAKHLNYMADRKVDVAIAQSTTAIAEDQRAVLSKRRDQARLDARTNEADVAASKLATARVEIADQKREVDASRDAADAARMVAAESARQSAEAAGKAAELQRQINELNAKPTDRGLVLTLGDVLFDTGKSDLKSGASANLGKLATFLHNYPERSAVIEGYTDSLGSDDYNMGLSQRRADSVKTFLTGQGVAPVRLAAAGKGKGSPVAGNDSAAGRQQNRRVEVIISNL
jgi:outer membrane protein OmpA-like peptidoglycan-associated protein